MALYTKCLKCGGWRKVPDDPSAAGRIPTGLMMNAPKPPANLCSCREEPKRS